MREQSNAVIRLADLQEQGERDERHVEGAVHALGFEPVKHEARQGEAAGIGRHCGAQQRVEPLYVLLAGGDPGVIPALGDKGRR